MWSGPSRALLAPPGILLPALTAVRVATRVSPSRRAFREHAIAPYQAMVASEKEPACNHVCPADQSEERRL